MAANWAKTQFVKLLSNKRKAAEEGLNSLLRMDVEIAKKRIADELFYEEEVAQAAALSAVLLSKKPRQERSHDEPRNNNWWSQGYDNWDDAAFKKRLRVSRDTFEFILAEIENDITKEPTPMKPHPTPPATQLALCLYRLAHGCTFLTVGDLFGVAAPTAHCIFMEVCKTIVKTLYDRFVFLPRTPEEWTNELQKFLENWEFPCVGAWDGFHVYVSTNLKNFYSYKKRYSVTNMGFIGYNKRFMWAAVGAPGSTHDSRLLRSCEIYSQFEEGHALPNRSLNLHPHGEIPLATVGDSAFPSRPWLLKPYKEGTRVPQQTYFNMRLCSARVVSEHAYGMLKGRWRILYKKTECALDNIKVIIMVCICLHNICIHRNDPCKERWRLKVNELNLIRGSGQAGDADTIREVISNWLWGIREERDAN